MIRRSLVLALLAGLPSLAVAQPTPTDKLFARDNLIAWCIVPFDSKARSPEDRAAMLEKLGFKHFAYDWRGEHIPTFDAELDALKKHHVALDAFWCAPGELNRESKIILDVLKRHGVKADLWALLDLGPDKVTGAEQERRVALAASKLKPLAEAAKAIGCRVALYNHGGWFGEPENQVAIIERLKMEGVDNVGIVYNLHHGHAHLDRLPTLLKTIMPHVWTINLNGMDRDGEAKGRKILPLGQGSLDLAVLRIIVDSGYKGPIGILGHTQDDAEARLRDNLDGLDWLVPQLEGKSPGPRPAPRTPVPGGAKTADLKPEESQAVARLVSEAQSSGNPRHGAELFASTRYACLSCHKVGDQGGTVGPELSFIGACAPPEHLAASILWPKQEVRPGFEAMAVETKDGRVLQGYKEVENARELALRDAASGKVETLARSTIEATKDLGTLMPDGLADAMTPEERRDVVRFLMDLGRSGDLHLAAMAHHPGTFPFVRDPIRPDRWPNWKHHVNRDRLYDFYAKEADYYLKQPVLPALLPQFPGLDGGSFGHWGNQSEPTWADGRWNLADLGSLQSGIFRGAGLTIPKGVCVRLGDDGQVSACFNPQTLKYEVDWRGGFVDFSDVRHGFMDGLRMKGTPAPGGSNTPPSQPFVYHGFYRHGRRVIFSYSVGGMEMLNTAWAYGDVMTNHVESGPMDFLAHLIKGGPAQWPQVIETKGKLGTTKPYAVDTIEPPFKNPWNVPVFFGDHDFLPDGTAFVCTIQGDVWRVEGLDEKLEHVRWKRFAAGLSLPLGLVVVDGKVHVLGRDQITRLHDLNNDGEADFYECVSNAYQTSPAGHDFICGLQRDAQGNFYTVSGNQGLIKIAPDGKTVTVLATGFRNPDGLGLTPQGVTTVPSSEGEWNPASMVCEVRPGDYFGYGGPKNGRPPSLPLVYLPRGLDNSSAAQTYVSSDKWGPLRGQILHFSYGAGTDFLLLREQVDGQPQGAVVPLHDEFLSGAHRGRFNPKDGQLYVSGMGGWGTYTPHDASFQRVRYTGDPVQLPVAFHAHENGVLLTFTRPLDPAVASSPKSHLAQAWNYRYSASYGSLEYSSKHPGTPGHDPLAIAGAHVLDDGKSLFLELPEIQPVNQLHLHLKVGDGDPIDLFATVHKLAAPFTGFPGYKPTPKVIAAHPILADLALASKAVPNPWKRKIKGARPIAIEAGKNLTFATTSFAVRAGEPIELTFKNPDVVPHNWALVKPGTLAKVGDLANKIITDPDAAARQYVPKTDDVIVHTDVVPPGDQFSISFRAPGAPGRYPYLCTFPGHWMVMNGVMIVE